MSKGIVIYLADLKDDVLKYVQANFALSTYKLYVTTFKNLIKYSGNVPIKLITTKQIDDYKCYRAGGIKKITVNKELTNIRAIFNLALKWNYLKENPARNVSKFRTEQTEILCFKDCELKPLFEIIPKGDLKDIANIAIETAFRIEELLNIQIKDIDLNERIIHIRNKPGFKTKTGKIRQFPISDKLYSLLRRFLEYDRNDYSLAEPEQYLFTNPKGFIYNRDYISKKFKKYLRACNLPEKYHFHCLRHTCITNWVRKGIHINIVMKLAGHSCLSTTMKYVHIVTDDLREAVNKVRQFTDYSY